MPIYEYECTSCHHHFDLIQKINDDPEKQCPSCHQDTAIKLVSAAGFQLKGNGWYVTDFKNKNAPATAKSTTKPAEKTTSEAGTSTNATSQSTGGTE